MHSLAMDEPSPWIICCEAHDQPTSGREKCSIAARRIVELEACLTPVPDTRALADDIVIWIECQYEQAFVGTHM
jgi:hypothetical protein